MTAVSKLALGTVQFGVDYGITNAGGQPGASAVSQMLELAWRSGIDMLDTAPGYGEAQDRIRRLAGPHHEWRIISKTPHLRSYGDGRCVDPARALDEALSATLRSLGTEFLHALLVHDAEDLLGAHAEVLIDWLQSARSRGLARNLGASLYHPEQARTMLDLGILDMVQIPLNVLDQRFVRSGVLTRLHDAGVSVHARSVFLQGLLLTEPDRLAPDMAFASEPLAAFRRACAESCKSPMIAALALPLADHRVERVLVGAQGPGELAKIIQSADQASRVDTAWLERLACYDLDVVVPTRWPR